LTTAVYDSGSYISNIHRKTKPVLFSNHGPYYSCITWLNAFVPFRFLNKICSLFHSLSFFKFSFKNNYVWMCIINVKLLKLIRLRFCTTMQLTTVMFIIKILLYAIMFCHSAFISLVILAQSQAAYFSQGRLCHPELLSCFNSLSSRLPRTKLVSAVADEAARLHRAVKRERGGRSV